MSSFQWTLVAVAGAVLFVAVIAAFRLYYYLEYGLRLKATGKLRYRSTPPRHLRYLRINLKNRSDFPVIVREVQLRKPSWKGSSEPTPFSGYRDLDLKLDARDGRSSIRLEPEDLRNHTDDILSGKHIYLLTHLDDAVRVRFPEKGWEEVETFAREGRTERG